MHLNNNKCNQQSRAHGLRYLAIRHKITTTPTIFSAVAGILCLIAKYLGPYESRVYMALLIGSYGMIRALTIALFLCKHMEGCH